MVVIRDAVLEDLPNILNIYNYAIVHLTATFDTEEETLEDRQNWFDNHNEKYPVIVAEMDGEVVGFSCLSPFKRKKAYSQSAEISIYTSPESQGKGIGKTLMEEIIERAKQNGLRTIIAVITSGNEASVRLHKKFGFKFAGRIKEVGYKFGQWLDVEYYQLLLK